MQIVVSGYRLTVMRLQTPALDAMGPGTLNTIGSKTTFYIFHVAPEFLAASLLFVFDMRRQCGTGLLGDWRWSDKKEVGEIKEVEDTTLGESTGRDNVDTVGKKDAVSVQQTPV